MATDGADAELRSKYDASTRLLQAQCDTIERLHERLREMQRLPESSNRASEAGDGWTPAGKENEALQVKYARAKRLVKLQSIELAKARESAKRASTVAEASEARAALAEQSLANTQDSALSLREDYARALERAQSEATALRRERDAEAANASAATTELSRALAATESATAQLREAVVAECRAKESLLDEASRREAADEEVHRLRQDLELTRNELADVNREVRTMNERLHAAETAATEAVKDAESARMGSVADRCAKSDAEEAAALLTARLEASERRASMMEAARDAAMTQRDVATERIETEAEESRKELDAARAAAAKAHGEAQKLTVALDDARRAATHAQTRVRELTERLETAEADYAYAEKLTEDAVKELETERARFELEGEKRARREKEFMREAEQAASQRWEAQTQDEVEDLRAQVTSLRAEKERAENLLAAAAAENAARVAAAEEKREAAELVATVVTAATATAVSPMATWVRGGGLAQNSYPTPSKATPPPLAAGYPTPGAGSTPGDATPRLPARAVPRRQRRAHARGGS